MTGPVTGDPDRSGAAPMRASGTRSAVSAILILLAAGFALRLIIAYILPGSGFRNDLASFEGWAQDLAANGTAGFYQRSPFIDYTPGYLYVLWLVGTVERALPGTDLIKIPAMLSDLAVGWLIWSMVQELGAGRRAALIGAGLFLFVPVTWFDSIVWGQVDSVGLIPALLAVRFLWRDRPELAVVFTVLAAIVKIQLGVILVPITAAVLLRRYIWDVRREDGPWRGPARLLSSGGAGLLTAAALSAPFGLSIFDLLDQVRKTAGGYPYLTVNAYNPWALVTRAGEGLAQSGQWLCDSVTGTAANTPCPPGGEILIGPLWASIVGDGLLVLLAVVVAVLVARRPDRLAILVGLAVLAIAFFVVPTRVHERYMFPFFAIAAILAAVSWRWLLAYAALAAVAFANMYVVLTTLYPDNPRIDDWLGVGPALRSFTGVATIAAVHALGLAWAMLQWRRSSREALEDEVARAADRLPAPAVILRPAREPAAGAAAAVRPDVAGAWLPAEGPEADAFPGALVAPSAASTVVGSAAAFAGAGPSASARAATTPAYAGTTPAYVAPFAASSVSEDEVGEPGLLDPILRRLSPTPLRADRSRLLDREGGGRLDRLDVWLLVWLVIASLFLRTWRLAEPASMHFDEVYHARTATEFLQDWRYGISHNIYEWTHPHLAKYAMAAGIVAWGDDRVTASSDLGAPVIDAAIEPRWEDARLPDQRAGDRLYVAVQAAPGGGAAAGVRVFDLATRQPLATFDLPGAANVALDPAGHQLFAVTADGTVFALDTTELDGLRIGATTSGLAPPVRVGTFGTAIARVATTTDGGRLVAITRAADVVSMDASSGTILGTVHLAGAADIAAAGRAEALIADPAAVSDPAAAATTLAGLIGGDAAKIKAALGRPGDQVVVAATIPSTVRQKVDDAIADGRLEGLSFEQVPVMAVADTAGLTLVFGLDASVSDELPITGGATGLALTSNLDAPRLYVAAGKGLAIVKLPAEGTAHIAPILESTIAMPGEVRRVTFDDSAIMVHALGTTPDGSASTIYVVEPHANAVFADAPLPFDPVAWVTDAQPDYPSADRQDILAFGPTGAVASVDIGSHEFSWRLPGVIAGALTAGLLFLLTRLLFRRRSVGVLVAILALADGMLFVQSRIAMNDVYVGLFLLAAYVLFAGLWLGRWRFRGAFWVLMPLIGLLLGLALASKWVAAYAIAAIGVLILVRSALGRVVAILGLAAATIYLGYQGLIVAVPTAAEVFRSGPNYLFMFLMIALTLLATVVTILHPVAWSVDEVRFAIGAPAAAGILIGLVAVPLGVMNQTFKLGPVAITPMTAALTLFVAALAMFGLFALAGRFGFGPMAPPLEPDDPARLAERSAEPPVAWLRLGSYLGAPVVWMGLCLVLLPVAVYVLSYVPWALNTGGLAGSPLIFPAGTPVIGAWPPGHDGQSLWQLTTQMYDYHNNLRSPHAAASPWWAWPFDLKPVWFYQGSFAGGTSAAIYDAGNLAIWWLGVPAMGFIAWQAFKRRSLGLALVTVGFAFQWLAWARIDRATFQYHYYTSVPFIIVALAYWLAELWHGASRRTWALARLSAAVAIMGPGLMWALKAPLCALVDVNRASPGSLACTGNPANLVVTARIGVVLAIVLVATIVIVYRLIHLDDRPRPGGRSRRDELILILAVAGLAAVAAELASLFVGDGTLVNIQGMSTQPVAVVALVILAGIAWFVITARDARRFVAGAVVAAIGEFVVFYPNIAALPMPATIFNAYQGLLPTYLYPFQFPVNTDPVPGHGPSIFTADPNLFGLPPVLVLGGVLAIACLVVAYSAWSWRVVLALRSEPPSDPGDGLRA